LFDVWLGNAGAIGHARVDAALEVLEFDRAAAQSIEILLPVAFADLHGCNLRFESAQRFSCTEVI
jgi:hypothetical protein